MRFVPDETLDLLLRPALMADPVYSMYIEIAAPDWRFLSLAALLVLVLIGRRHWAVLQRHQFLTLLGLAIGFYVWAAVSGNGRYFIWGLLLVGPLVVVAARELVATVAMRNTVIVGVLTVQGVAAYTSFEANTWAIRPWTSGTGLELEPNEVRRDPAVFLTLSGISYSALVPQMHPDSRWSNISGQFELLPGVREFPALRDLLASPLPKFAVARSHNLNIGPDLQPLPGASASLQRLLQRHGLRRTSPTCTHVRTSQGAEDIRTGKPRASEDGFWFCPVEYVGHPAAEPDRPVATPPEVERVLQRLQAHCPVLLAAGGGVTRQLHDGYQRTWNHSDMTVYVMDSGEVYYKHLRAINPTRLGLWEPVARGEFQLDCSRVPGRYLPPWSRH